jgi:hypothetical protein
VQGVVVTRLNRLARDVMVQELLLRKLSDLGGTVLSTRENDNEMLNRESKEPSRKLVHVIMGAISEYDREMPWTGSPHAAQPRPLVAATHTARCPTATAPPTASSCRPRRAGGAGEDENAVVAGHLHAGLVHASYHRSLRARQRQEATSNPVTGSAARSGDGFGHAA